MALSLQALSHRARSHQALVIGLVIGSMGPLVGQSPSRPSLEPLAASEWSLATARHLLDRAGFGATPEQLIEFHSLGLEGAVSRVLAHASEREAAVGFEAHYVRKK